MSSQSKPPHFPEPEGTGHSAEPEATADEAKLAEALARALEEPRAERERGGEHLGGLLETATLVKASRHFELPEERKKSLRVELDALLAERDAARATRKKTTGLWWRLSLLAAGVAGVFATVRVASHAEAPERVAATEPASTAATTTTPGSPAPATNDGATPPPALLRAQAAALAKAVVPSDAAGAESRAALDRELRTYRSTLMASLDERLR
jgi:hypothetical protein